MYTSSYEKEKNNKKKIVAKKKEQKETPMYMCMYKTREATRREEGTIRVVRPTKKYTICTHGTEQKRGKKKTSKMLRLQGGEDRGEEL